MLKKLEKVKKPGGVRMADARAIAASEKFSLGPTRGDVYKEVKKVIDRENLKVSR